MILIKKVVNILRFYPIKMVAKKNKEEYFKEYLEKKKKAREYYKSLDVKKLEFFNFLQRIWKEKL